MTTVNTYSDSAENFCEDITVDLSSKEIQLLFGAYWGFENL